MYININSLMKEYKERQGIVEDLEEIRSTVKHLQEKVDADAKLLEKAEQGIPYGKNLHLLLASLETFIKRHDLIQHAFAPENLEDKEKYYILPVKIRVSGSFDNIVGFLKDWENYPRIINIDEARLYSEGDGSIVGEFVANIYIFKTEEGFIEDFDNITFDGEAGRSDPLAPI